MAERFFVHVNSDQSVMWLLTADGDDHVLRVGDRDVRGLPGAIIWGKPYCSPLMTFWCQNSA
jgi:hypothetical protein